MNKSFAEKLLRKVIKKLVFYGLILFPVGFGGLRIVNKSVVLQKKLSTKPFPKRICEI